MFHEMRKKERQLTQEEAVKLLEKCTYGVLCTYGEDGYPYGVPLSYAYQDGVLYFHGAANVGHKMENIKNHHRASFTVVGDTQTLPEKFSTKYESAIAFGKIVLPEDKLAALEKLIKKYSPDYEGKGRKYAKSSMEKAGVFALQIEHITGKARR